MHVLRLQRRQALARMERRYTSSDIESDEDGAEGFELAFSDGDASSGDESTGDPRECNIT